MTRHPDLRIGLTLALLCLIWGTTWSVIQIGLEGIPPLSGVAIRFSLAGLLLLVLARLRGVKLGASRRERMLWVVNGVLSFSLSYGVVYWAEQWVPSGLAAVLFATYPLLVAMLAHFALPDEPMKRIEVFGIVVAFSGIGLIYSTDFSALGGPQVAFAAGLLMLSPLAAAAGSVAVKKWGRGIHAYSLTAVPMLITGLLMGCLAFVFERDRPLTFDFRSLAALAYLTVVGSAVTFTLYYRLLEQLPAKRLALIAYVIPVIAVLIGTLRGEPFTPRILTGSALVVLGVALALQRFSRSRPILP